MCRSPSVSDDITKVCKSWGLKCLRAEARVGGRVQSARRRAAVVQGTTEQPGRLFLVSEKDFGEPLSARFNLDEETAATVCEETLASAGDEMLVSRGLCINHERCSIEGQDLP